MALLNMRCKRTWFDDYIYDYNSNQPTSSTELHKLLLSVSMNNFTTWYCFTIILFMICGGKETDSFLNQIMTWVLGRCFCCSKTHTHKILFGKVIKRLKNIFFYSSLEQILFFYCQMREERHKYIFFAPTEKN